MKIWNPTNGNCELTLTGHEGRIWTVSLSPDDKYIVSGGDDGTVRVCDASNGNEIMVFRGHEGRVCSVTFTPNSRRIISGGDDGTIRVWDLQWKVELMELMTFGKHNLYRWTIAVSPNGKRIAYINPGDHTVVVIDAATGSHVLTIPIPGMRQGSLGRFSPTSLVFSPNGKTIALTCDKSLLLLESEVPTERYEDRRNARKARKLVDQLYAEHRSYVKVTNLLRVDTIYTKEIREKALQISLSRQWDDMDREVEESLEIACVAGKDISEYRQALQQAQRANNSQPNDELGLLALGIAQYRVGAYKEAYKSLVGEDEMKINFYEDSYPMKLSFIAMTLYQIGHKEKAETALNQLRKKCENEPYAKNKQALTFLGEVEKLIIGEKQ